METNPDSGLSQIVVKVGPFKDRRSALRKLSSWAGEEDKNPKQGA